VLEAVIAEGATTINVPDTVGYAIPELYGNIHPDICARRIPNSDKAIWSVHCHNDLGMAVANSLAGVQTWWRAAGGVHHQRPGRARRQLQPGRGRHGGQDASRLFRPGQ